MFLGAFWDDFQDLNLHQWRHWNKILKQKEYKLVNLSNLVAGLNSVSNQNKYDWHMVEVTGRTGCQVELDCNSITVCILVKENSEVLGYC